MQRKPTAESRIAEMLADDLMQIDGKVPIRMQVDTFLDNIGMDSKNKFVKEAFVIASTKSVRIIYSDIMAQLNRLHPYCNEELLMLNLKGEFDRWLLLHPELKEQCPRVGFTSLLRVFASTVSAAKIAARPVYY